MEFTVHADRVVSSDVDINGEPASTGLRRNAPSDTGRLWTR